MGFDDTLLSNAGQQTASGLATPPESTQQADRLNSICQLGARVAAILSMLIGSMVLLGWGFGVEFLKIPLPGQITIKSNAALCFVLGGLALLRLPRWTITCACCIAAISGLTLVEYVLGVNLGIDQILFREPPGAFGTVHPNRMAPNAAVGFVLLAAALQLIASRRAIPVAQSLALAAGAIVAAALVGYFFGVQPLQGLPGLTHIAPPAAFAMLALAAGVLLASADRGLMGCLTGASAGGLMARRLLPVALLPIVTGILSQVGQRAGLFDAQLHSALDALVGSYLFVGFIWWNAASLHRVDGARQRATEALGETLGSLEHRVAERTGELAEANAALQAEVAERRRTEDELSKSERRFRSLVEATAAIVWHTTPSGEVDAENLSWTAFTGQSFEQLKGWGWLDSVHPEDREHTVRLWSQAIESRRPYEAEHRLRDRYGQYHDMSIRGVPILFDDGTVQEWVGLHQDITAQKQAVANVRLLSSLIDLAHDAIIIRQPGGSVSYWNRGAERVYGWSKEQAMWLVSQELLKTQFPKPLAEIEADVVREGSWEGEIVHARSDGQRVVVSSRWIYDRDLPGEVKPILEIDSDITQRKQAEEQLRKLARAIEQGPTSIVITDPSGAIEYVNPKFTEVTGYTLEEVRGENPRVLKSGEMQQSEYQQLWETIRAGREWRGEFHNKKKNGELFWESASISPVFDEHGIITHFVSVKEEITERKRIEEVVRDREARLRAIVITAVDGIITIDARGFIDTFNPAAERIFGYRAEEVVGQNVNCLMPSPQHEEHDDYLSNYLRTGERKMIGIGREVVGRRKDGSTFPLELSVGEVLVGGLRMFTGIMRDITDRKQAQALLERHAAELARSNAELEQFAYVASHDLQEPLRMVASYLELLAERYKGQLDPKADKYIHYAVDGAARMKTLIDDLLRFSRVTTQAKPFERMDAQSVFKAAMENLGGAIAEKGATVTHDALPSILGDRIQLLQLFQNLIGNAIKFSGDRPPRVHIGAKRSGAEWLFTVTDNGIGVAPQHAQRIFQIFQRLHGRDRYPGTGIGLAICRKVVENHGGRIWVEPQPGEGSTFAFTLPIREMTSP